MRLLFIFPVAVLDGLFYWWVFSGLTRTLLQLSARRQSAKLRLYKRFSYLLITSVIVSGLWACLQMFVIVRANLDEHWASLWVFDAGWHMLHFIILGTACYLWSPSKNNLTYACTDELPLDGIQEAGRAAIA